MNKKVTFFVLTCLSAIAAAAVWSVSASWGVVLNDGSLMLMQAARNYAIGLGLSVPSDGGLLRPLVEHPPLFPFILGWGLFLGMEVAQWARYVMAAIFAANVFLAGRLAFTWARNDVAAVLASLMTLVSLQVFAGHATLSAMPLFVFFALGCFWSLYRYLRQGAKKMFYVCAFLAVCAVMTSFAGWALVVSVIVVLASQHDLKPLVAYRETVLFKLCVLPMPLLWLVFTWRVSSWNGFYEFGWYPLTAKHAQTLFDSLTLWLATTEVAGNIRLFSGLSLLAAAVFVIHRVRQRTRMVASQTQVGFLLEVFICVYLFLALLVALFIHPQLMPDQTFFMPVYVIVAIALARAFMYQSGLYEKGKFARLIIILFILLSFGRSIAWWMQTAQQGAGYSSKVWKDSRLTKELRSLDDSVEVYSDNIFLAQHLTGRRAKKLFTSSQKEAYPYIPSQVAASFEARKAIAIIFDAGSAASGRLWRELKAAVPLVAPISEDLGTVYVRAKK